MAYTAVLTKVSVTKESSVLYSIEVNCKISDGATVIFEQNATVKHNINTGNFNTFRDAVINELKPIWDKFKAEQVIFSAAQLDTALSTIQSQINTYINL
jgi:hypothetical protein